MNIERPDLSQIDPAVRAYIESLEAELKTLKSDREPAKVISPVSLPSEPSEPPTTLNVITVSVSGIAKRTPRHLYTHQRRGGMGIFDLETSEDDPPALLTVADKNQTLLLLTDRARAFHLPVNELPESPVRSRGRAVADFLPIAPDERLAAVLSLESSGYVAMASERGYVRALRYNIVGENMRPGAQLLDIDRFGQLVAACWTPGDGDLYIATRTGKAIRFAEKTVDLSGSLGIRLGSGDVPVAIAAVTEGSRVFLLGADGKGTIRLMSGFRANKSPGAAGKIAMKSDRLVGAVTVTEADDLFIISRLSKVIRFGTGEVPPTEGAVQGVNCMALRSDECVAVVTSGLPKPSAGALRSLIPNIT